MRKFVLIILAIIIASGILLRYEISVHSPIVVKLDRWTGKAWVANSGVWMDIGHELKAQ